MSNPDDEKIGKTAVQHVVQSYKILPLTTDPTAARAKALAKYRASKAFVVIRLAHLAGGVLTVISLIAVVAALYDYVSRHQAYYKSDMDGGTVVQNSVSPAVIAVYGVVIIVILVIPVVIKIWSDSLRDNVVNQMLLRTPAASTEEKGDTASDQPKKELQFENLWESNKTQITNYHGIVLNYATKTRAFTLFSLIAGFLLILVIAILAATSNNSASAIAAGVVGASTAALTGFIANATLRNAEHSARELQAFFEHPLNVEKALAAERISRLMTEDDQTKAQFQIIDYLTAVSPAQL